jgi:hypothetical protein
VGRLVIVALLLSGCLNAHPGQCECADQQAGLIAHVNDAITNAPIAQPTFAEAGAMLGATCMEQTAGSPCTSWFIPVVGPHDVTISATGYGAQTVHLDLLQPGGCCSQGEQLEQTVSLTPSP